MEMWAVSAAIFEKGALSNCGNTGAVSGTRYISGIAGLNTGTIGTISSAYNTGAVSGTYYIGGIAGYNSATISSAYNTGTVTARSSNQVGGAGPQQRHNLFCL